MRKTLVRLAIVAGLALAGIAGHNVHWYGMPGQHVWSPVACFRPDPAKRPTDLTDPTLGPVELGVCYESPDTPATNTGAALSLWDGYCIGLELRPVPGPFWRLPLIGGTADC